MCLAHLQFREGASERQRLKELGDAKIQLFFQSTQRPSVMGQSPIIFYCRSNTRMLGALLRGMCTVSVKVLRSEESFISWVFVTLLLNLPVISRVSLFTRRAEDADPGGALAPTFG